MKITSIAQTDEFTTLRKSRKNESTLLFLEEIHRNFERCTTTEEITAQREKIRELIIIKFSQSIHDYHRLESLVNKLMAARCLKLNG